MSFIDNESLLKNIRPLSNYSAVISLCTLYCLYSTNLIPYINTFKTAPKDELSISLYI